MDKYILFDLMVAILVCVVGFLFLYGSLNDGYANLSADIGSLINLILKK